MLEEFLKVVESLNQHIMSCPSKEELESLRNLITSTWEENMRDFTKEDRELIFEPLKRDWLKMIDERLLEWKN